MDKIEFNNDPEYLKKMAEEEDYGCISVGGRITGEIPFYDLLICPSCGKMPIAEKKYTYKVGKVTYVKCNTNDCPMSSQNWRSIYNWNKRFVITLKGRDYFVGDVVGVFWNDDKEGEFTVPMKISPLENGAYYLYPLNNSPVKCWKIHISAALGEDGEIEFIELEDKKEIKEPKEPEIDRVDKYEDF